MIIILGFYEPHNLITSKPYGGGEAPHLLCPGPSGNHPFLTRSFCWYNSRMLQKDEKAVTPSIVEAIRLSTMNDKTQNTTPAMRNIHQHLTPR